MAAPASHARRATPSDRHARLRRRDRARIGRDGPPDDLVLTRAEGCLLFDDRGRRYVDLTSGWCVANFGWAHPEIVEQLRSFDGPDYVSPSFMYAPWVELAERLAEIAPGSLSRCFRATGGMEAVEIAIQIAMAYTDRPGVLAIEGAYHGTSFAARAAVDAEGPRVPHFRRISPPIDARAAQKIDTLLARRDVAAVVLEPIVLNLGVLSPDADALRDVRRSCEQHGTLLVADEVASGFGRTGRLFACEHYALEPDILCVAKAITGGHAPMGATLTTAAIADAVAGSLQVYSTFGWHPRSVAAALATLGWLRRNERELLANVAARSEQITSRLRAMPALSGAEIRARGLAIGIELDGDDAGDRLADRCRAEGVIVSGEGDTVSLFPPLVIDEATTEQALARFERALPR